MRLTPKHLVLYDGDCGLCQRSVWWIAKRDPKGVFVFASQQMPKVADWMQQNALERVEALLIVRNVFDANHLGGSHERQGLKTASFVNGPIEILARERTNDRETGIGPKAVGLILRDLPGLWSWVGRILLVIPSAISMRIYRIIAKMRKRIFSNDSCPMHSKKSTEWIRQRIWT